MKKEHLEYQLGRPSQKVEDWINRPTYAVNAVPNDETYGMTYGSGDYRKFALTTISAEENEDCIFTNWSDENTDNPRELFVLNDVNLTANFERSLALLMRSNSKHTYVFLPDDPKINYTLQYLNPDSSTVLEPYNEVSELANLNNLVRVSDTSKQISAIGNLSFSNCQNLTSINLQNVVEIGSNAFSNCTALTELSFPNVEKLNDLQFLQCRNISSISFLRLTQVGDYAFFGCTNLKSLDLPNLTAADFYAFSYCENISVVLLSSIIVIGPHVFYNCTLLNTIDISKVENIEYSAFDKCPKLSTVLLSAILTPPTVNINTFGSPRAWPISVYIPLGLLDSFMEDFTWNQLVNNKTILLVEPPRLVMKSTSGTNCYFDASDPLIAGTLTYLYRGNALPPYNLCAEIDDRNELVAVDDKYGMISVIGNNSFEYCKKLSSVNFPSVIKLSYAAFCGCDSVSSFNFPNVISMDDGTFYECRELRTINIPRLSSFNGLFFAGTAQYLESISLSSVSTVPLYFIDFRRTTLLKPVSVYIPSGMTDDFMNAKFWPDRVNDGTILFVEVPLQ